MTMDTINNPFISFEWYQNSSIRKMPVDTSRGTIMKRYYDIGDRAFIFELFFQKNLHKKLSNSALRVFMIILEQILDTKTDIIYLTYDNEMEMGKSSFYAGLKELIKHQILAKTSQRYRYWVNPFYFNHHNPIHEINKYQK